MNCVSALACASAPAFEYLCVGVYGVAHCRFPSRSLHALFCPLDCSASLLDCSYMVHRSERKRFLAHLLTPCEGVSKLPKDLIDLSADEVVGLVWKPILLSAYLLLPPYRKESQSGHSTLPSNVTSEALSSV